MRRLAILLLVGFTITAACVIGPKHDDPESDLAADDSGSSDDGSFSTDTTPGSIPSDTGTSDGVDALSGGGDVGKTEDAGSDSAGDAPSDGALDAPSDAASDAVDDAAEGG
jgi:hypothetical protein